VVFVATDLDRSRRFTKRLLEKAQVTTFAGLDADNAASRAMVRRDVAVQLRQELERAGRTIDPKTLELLVDRAGGDISKLRGDVERLLLYTEGQSRITRSDVEDVASDAAVEDDWAIVNAIADGDPARALREAGARLDRGDSPHMLMGQLRWWVSNRLVQGAPERVKPALDALLRTDLALKSSGGEDRVLIERLVAELTGRAVPRFAGPGYGRR
jgi:DNA polymerase III delta subunit